MIVYVYICIWWSYSCNSSSIHSQANLAAIGPVPRPIDRFFIDFLVCATFSSLFLSLCLSPSPYKKLKPNPFVDISILSCQFSKKQSTVGQWLRGAASESDQNGHHRGFWWQIPSWRWRTHSRPVSTPFSFGSSRWYRNRSRPAREDSKPKEQVNLLLLFLKKQKTKIVIVPIITVYGWIGKCVVSIIYSDAIDSDFIYLLTQQI